jgi:hypothetical protein
MREQIISQLQMFAKELTAIGKLVLRAPWGRDTAKGLDAVQHLSGIAQLATDLSEKLAAEDGPVEATMAQRLMDLGETAETAAADWPDETLKKSVEIAATRLDTFVLNRWPSFSGDTVSFS